MTTQHDEQQRLKALDPTQSFIVQAPAGSGKTELLIQRFLVLLSVVKQPEEILAITFTKKSAAEMRTRIINALKNAQNNPEPDSSHAKKTWHLAKKALKQDEELKWNLLISPSRLRLQTIDSFNMSITRQLPIVSHFGASPEITDNPYSLYRQAVQDFLTHLEEDHTWSNAIGTVLLHVDNDLNKVENLFINLLAKRDQWLRYIILNSNDPLLRQTLEQNLQTIAIDSLKNLHLLFPKQHINELLYLLRFSAHYLKQDKPASLIVHCLNLDTLPGITIEDKKCWSGIAEFLLTKSNTWRKKIDKDIGFLSITSCKNAIEKDLINNAKLRMKKLIDELSHATYFFHALIDFTFLPEITYRESQWHTLESLHTVLKMVTAQLHLVFQKQGKIDYIENALAADAALGTYESPTDLTLALDYQIKHILIDEFQDTSNSQYQLLKKITAGWEHNDGRTLFLVGDPMQSIYRFREAEVGIFIRARKYGMGPIQLEPLTLSVNFRSTPEIAHWINTHFQKIFPSFDDVATGAVAYTASIANQFTQHANSTVTLHSLVNAEDDTQAKTIVELIQERKIHHPTETIAILVRSRTHLAKIIPTLKAAAIKYRSINIDPLTERPFIQDLMALTRALFHPADRIAWLALLRAPWCGLSLNDLFILSGRNAKISLWEQLHSSQILAGLSIDGQARIKRILPILKAKIAERYRSSARYWIESTWLLLGGPATVIEETDLEDAEAYFCLLEKMDQSSNLLNLDTLHEQVNNLYAAPNNQADDTLQIMTIHNAKGLEFDTVILPHLERRAANDHKQLLLWLDQPRTKENNMLVIAPVHAIGHETDTIYEYIKRQHAIKNNYEIGRLLYVAATRAKKNLALFFNLKNDCKVNSSSLLEKIWPTIKNQLSYTEPTSSFTYTKPENNNPLKRLPLQWKNPITEHCLTEELVYHQQKSGFHLPDNQPKYIGIIIHQTLQQISKLGYTWWQSSSPANKLTYLQKSLLQLGIQKVNLKKTSALIKQIIDNTLTDERGRWIVFPHNEAESVKVLSII